LEHILKQFQKHMFSRCTFLRDATSQATADLTSIEPFPNLHVLASRGNVPKAHLIFCHAVQLNPLQVAKVHLRPGGTLFYSVHRDDSPENIRRGFNPEPPFCYRFLPKAKNPMLLNPLVGSFPTHPGVHGIMHGELGSQAPWV
jgi:SAM-dependent methyltransferase